MTFSRYPFVCAGHRMAADQRSVKIAAIVMMLLLHAGILMTALYGKAASPHIQPIRSAVAATLLAGPGQVQPAAPQALAQASDPFASIASAQAAKPEVKPPDLPPHEPARHEPEKSRNTDSKPKHQKRADLTPPPAGADHAVARPPRKPGQAAHPDSPAPVASAGSAAATAAVSPPTHDAAAPASGGSHSSPAASIAPGVQCKTPEYPKASRRMSEEGVVSLRFLIDSDGRVLTSEVEKSSGYGRLDDAARNALSLCQFRPGQIEGKPIQSWARINYSWKLK